MKRSKVLVASVLALVVVVLTYQRLTTSNREAQESVVWLLDAELQAACSGVEILYDAKPYVLTAAHCGSALVQELDVLSSTLYWSFNAKFADESYHKLSVLKVDPLVDLMLLKSYRTKGITIAEEAYENQPVHTITYGGGNPLFRTDGILLKQDYTPRGADPSFIKTLTTAWVIPGSSGGPLFNSSNELVGIITNYNGLFSYSSSLAQIKKFLRDL
jgi:S1-C subfamily serine protease